YLGLEPRLNGFESGTGGADGITQIGAGVIGPASAERNCKSSHLTIKQQGICSRSPPILQARFVDDIHFGEKLSREWSDGAEIPIKEGELSGPKGLAGQLMRKHDSEAGRRAVRSRMQRVCKCHGII
ncbi:Similar to wnt8b: Protein Wnt-8b (Xenopus laevis), partial [Cotesia congregata]